MARSCSPRKMGPSRRPGKWRCGPRPTASPISTPSASGRSHESDVDHAPQAERGSKEEIMTYAMKPLACEPTRIKGMSERLIESHYENNYGGASNRLNAITAPLAELDFATAPGFVVNGLKREELIASDSMILHELFFASLGEESAPDGELREALVRDFGSVDRWRAEFAAMGKAQGGGSGWVLLTWSPRDRKLLSHWAMDHTT